MSKNMINFETARHGALYRIHLEGFKQLETLSNIVKWHALYIPLIKYVYNQYKPEKKNPKSIKQLTLSILDIDV